MLTEAQLAALFLEVHRAIEESANNAAEVIAGTNPASDLAYPPNGGITAAEVDFLVSGGRGASAVAPLRRIIADAAAAPLFRLFALIDGVADPSDWDGDWPCMQLSPSPDDDDGQPMLHDAAGDSIPPTSPQTTTERAAFNDILRGGFGTPEGGFRLIWCDADASRERLGYAETARQLELRLQRCHHESRATVAAALAAAKERRGPTAFDWLVDIINGHADIELVLS